MSNVGEGQRRVGAFFKIFQDLPVLKLFAPAPDSANYENVVRSFPVEAVRDVHLTELLHEVGLLLVLKGLLQRHDVRMVHEAQDLSSLAAVGGRRAV